MLLLLELFAPPHCSTTADAPCILLSYTEMDTVVFLGQEMTEVFFPNIFFIFPIMRLYYFYNEKIATKNK